MEGSRIASWWESALTSSPLRLHAYLILIKEFNNMPCSLSAGALIHSKWTLNGGAANVQAAARHTAPQRARNRRRALLWSAGARREA